jgi:hypothetical protein
MDPISRSAKPFCHGERGAIGRLPSAERIGAIPFQGESLGCTPIAFPAGKGFRVMELLGGHPRGQLRQVLLLLSFGRSVVADYASRARAIERPSR